MTLKHYLILIGSLFLAPLFYDLFKGRAALKELLSDKVRRIELLIVSVVIFGIVWCILATYLNTELLPFSTKY